MRKRRLGFTDLEFTTVGLGTWAIGGPDWKFGWGAQDDDQAVAAIVRGVEMGVNWIDTAAIYGCGHSEELVAIALKKLGPSRKPLIATKCSRIPQPDGNIIGCLKRESVLAEVEASLRRLQVDCIDLYQIHRNDPDAQLEEGWAAMAEIFKQGKARAIGVSNFTLAQLQRVQPIHPIASLQPYYSMLDPGIEHDLLPFCAQHRIGVVVYSPMHKGLLTGAFTAERARGLPANDHRSRDPRFQEPELTANLALVEGLRPIAQRHGKTLGQLAIAWTLRRPEVTSAIVGVRRPQQIEETAPAGDWTLDARDLADIARLLQQRDAVLSQPARG